MDAKQINNRAMQLLSKGEFVSAQNMFYLNIQNNPCCQTYNNIGAFLFDNGMTLKNGKDISAVGYAKRYVKKALSYAQNTIVFQNLARIYYEEKDYESAYKYYSMAYDGDPNEKVIYNQAVSLIGLHKYSEAYDCFKAIQHPLQEMISPYLITMAICDKENFEFLHMSNQLQELIEQMKLPDQMLLFYLCNQHHKVVEIEKELREQWSLSENDWAILIDSFLKTKESQLIENIIQREMSHYTSTGEKRFYKIIDSLYYDAQKRNKIIKCYLHTLCFPQIQLCSYYGCDSHNTSWEI